MSSLPIAPAKAPLDWNALAACAVSPFPADWPDDTYIFCSPRDPGVHEAIAAVLRSCARSCKVNMFGYDDDELDKILHGLAGDPTITFQMSLDSSQAGGVHERVLLLPWAKAEGTTIAVGHSIKSAISHMKVAVVDGLYVIDGSTNWSLSGEQKQDNQLGVRRNTAIARHYSDILDANHAAMLKQMKP
jgi:phosphatidylserine/phosphatidylglycerophosphate/cardiolipin synthase-like enzyme